jgi:cytochrome c oxidase assembly protein subunit 15
MEVGLGFVMANFGMPYFVQPLHLLFALLIFGNQYSLYLIINEKKDLSESVAYGK